MQSMQVTPERFGVAKELLLLREDDLKEALETIGFTLSDEEMVCDSKGRQAVCPVCKTPLRKDNIGSFFPGSIEIICNSFPCFIGEMAKVRTKIRAGK